MIDKSTKGSRSSKASVKTGPRIVALADTSAGLGSPQIEMLLQSLAKKYRASECWLIEPDVKGKLTFQATPGVKYRRFATRFPPHFFEFHIEYNQLISAFLEEQPADVLIITSAAVFPALLKLKNPPRIVIYYMLENLDYQLQIGGQDFLNLHQMARPLIDLVCVPEAERAGFDLKWLGWGDVATVELYNVSSDGFTRWPRRTELRMLSAGTVSEQTMSHLLLQDPLCRFPIDVYGIIDTLSLREAFEGQPPRRDGMAFKGSLAMDRLQAIFGRYAYSLVMWAPTSINQIHASPNKFFQSISHGVPPISAPHPQCVQVLRRYDCGILLEDWTREALIAGLQTATDLFGTARYDEMVANCEAACLAELNWPRQFEKVTDAIPAKLEVHA